MLGFKEALLAYREAITNLSTILLEVFSLALGERREGLKHLFSPGTTCLRLQHYPPKTENICDAKAKETVYGIAPHTDYGFFTLLAQDQVGGLQVLNSFDEWVDVPYLEGAFVLNTGDMFQRMSNNTFKRPLQK